MVCLNKNITMDDLIKALTIFRKYMGGDHPYPTACEHDVLYVNCNPEKVSDEDKVTLEELGFFPDEELGDCFCSFKYGS